MCWGMLSQDTRGDRQPSFTQMDLEMTFADQDVIMKLTEDLMRTVFKEVMPHHAYQHLLQYPNQPHPPLTSPMQPVPPSLSCPLPPPPPSRLLVPPHPPYSKAMFLLTETAAIHAGYSMANFPAQPRATFLAGYMYCNLLSLAKPCKESTCTACCLGKPSPPALSVL